MSCSNQGVGCCSHSKPCSICTPGLPCDPCGPPPPCNAYNPYSACDPCGPCNPNQPCNPSGPCGPCGPCGQCGPCKASQPCITCNPCNPCDPCPPPCCVEEPRRRMERLFDPKRVPYYPCSEKACQYFGSHDTNPPPGEAYLSSRSHFRNPNLKSLGIPVGMVKSSFPFRTVEAKGTDFQTQRFATYLKAFAMIYLTPEINWDTATIDELLSEGQQLYTASMAPPPDGEESPEIVASPIYSDKEQKVLREFELKGYKFGVELTEKYLPNAFRNALQKNGDEPLPDFTVNMLRPAMKGFFRKGKFCLVRVASWYMLVWKARGVYFVFDFFGRRENDFNSDREQGVAVLLCLKTLDNVLHLIRNLSNVTATDPIELRELKVVKLTLPNGRTLNRDYNRRNNEYNVISPEYAYLTGTLHLSLKQTDPLRSRSALAVAVAAMLASKIDHPATWTRAVVDKIICYGVNVCHCCWEQCLHSKEPIEIDRFPNRLRMGQFGLQFSLTPSVYEGLWRCVPNYIKSDLVLALEQCFANGENKLVIQVDNQMYAVWKKNNYIYLFDPYRHRIIGSLKHSDLSTKSASVRMFRSLDTFMAVFTQMLLENTQTTQFQIHTLTVNRIVNLQSPDAEAQALDAGKGEVMSLNETICFEEDASKCKDLLGEISEEEEEEVPIFEEKEPKSESEASEHLPEEEEGGAEDLGEYEESSSGGGHHRGRRRGRKRGGDSAKRKRSQSKGGGKGKGKRGKSKEKGKKAKKEKKPKEKDDSKKKRKKSKTPERDDSKKRKKKSKSAGDSDDESKKRKKSKEPKPKEEKPKPPPPAKKEPPKKDEPKKEEPKKEEPKKEPPKKEEPKKEEPKKSETPKSMSQVDPNRGQGTTRPSRERSSKEPTRQGGDKAPVDRSDGGYPSRGSDDGETRAAKCKANTYPGYSPVAHDMAVVGSESGTYESICKLLRAGFKCADRILTMTPWGNYVVFRGHTMYARNYFVFDGCTCNVNRFRHLDLSCGTAGLLCYPNLHDVICYMLDSEKISSCLKKGSRNVVDDICRKYGC